MAKTKKKSNNNLDNKAKELKNCLRSLYANIDRYYVNNFYYELLNKKNPDRFTSIVLNMLTPEMKVLELGLSPGTLTIEAALKVSASMGVDSKPMKVVIAENLKHIEYDKFFLINKLDNIGIDPEQLLKAKFRVVQFNDLEFEDNYFDVIFSNAGIEEDIKPVLENTVRCLKNGGKFIFKIKKKNKLFFDFNAEKGKPKVSKINDSFIINWAKNNNLKLEKKETIISKASKKEVSTILIFSS